MSRQIRHRATGVALAVLFAAAPLLLAGQARADWAQSGNRVVFDGAGMFGLPCAARPDLQSLRVPANSTVQVVNSTGHDADLVLDGESLGGIPDAGSTQVVFHRGTVALSLEPDCLLRDESAPVLVTAAPSGTPFPSGPTPIPVPTTPPSGPATVPPTPVPTTPGPTRPTPTPTSTRSAPPTSGPSRPVPSPTRTVRPTRRPHPTPSSATPQTRRPSTPATPTGAVLTPTATPVTPRAQSQPHQTPTGTPAAAPSSSAPVSTDLSLGDDGLSDAPAMELAPSAEPVPSSGSAAEPVATLEPLSRSGSTGLLALTAAVCVTGVMAGAVRTIAAQRASRANMA